MKIQLNKKNVDPALWNFFLRGSADAPEAREGKPHYLTDL